MSRKNRSFSLPKTTNTPLLYDGTTEAKLILMDILKTYAQQEGLASENELSTQAQGILQHALFYLKGIDVAVPGMWSFDFFGNVDNCQICHGESGGELGNENLVNGVITCDYCHARMLSGLIDEPTWDGTGPTPYVTAKTEKKPELIQITPTENSNVEKQSNPRHFPEGD